MVSPNGFFQLIGDIFESLTVQSFSHITHILNSLLNYIKLSPNELILDFFLKNNISSWLSEKIPELNQEDANQFRILQEEINQLKS